MAPTGRSKTCICVCVQSCLTLHDPMDYSQPGSSFHGIPQARVLELVAISYFKPVDPDSNSTSSEKPVS